MARRRDDSTPAQWLAETAVACLEASSQLQQAISFTSPKKHDAVFSKASHSQPPWNSPVAFSFFGLHQLARHAEELLRISAELPARLRGGSDANTASALEAAVKLAEKAPESVVAEAARDLARWLRDAKVILGELELPQRLPRLPGKPEPVCPFCKRKTLRMFPLQGCIVCIMPLSLCHDEDGRKPRARMEYSSFTKQWEVCWQDGVLGIPVPADEVRQPL